MSTPCTRHAPGFDEPTTAADEPAPRLTLADVFRRFAEPYRRQYGPHLTPQQERVLRELEICRTRVLGGHQRRCDTCGHTEYQFHSCLTFICTCSGRPAD